MIKKNLVKGVTKYWKKLEKENLHMCPSFTLFRLLNNNKIKLRNRDVLDIGFGEGQNLEEFLRRGSNIYGIDLRKEKINKIIFLTKVNKKNFYQCDLNVSFPKINKKFDLIINMDLINYLTEENQIRLFNESLKILKKNGFFLIHYPQMQLLKKKNDDIFNYEISKKVYSEDYFFKKENPIIFLKNKQIIKLINKFQKKFKLISSIFDTNTRSEKNSSKITINRFILFKKIS